MRGLQRWMANVESHFKWLNERSTTCDTSICQETFYTSNQFLISFNSLNYKHIKCFTLMILNKKSDVYNV